MTAPDQLFDRAAGSLPGPAAPYQGAGLACWLAAAALLALQLPSWAAAALVAGGWLLTGLGDGKARDEGRVDPPVQALGLTVLPFGFVLADPSRALPGMFLTFALAVWLTAGQGFGKSWFGVVLTLAYGAAALLPYHFSPLAYLIGVVSFSLAGQGAVRR